MVTTIATLTDAQREELESILRSDERRLLRLIGTADTGRGDVTYGPAAAEAESAQRIELEM